MNDEAKKALEFDRESLADRIWSYGWWSVGYDAPVQPAMTPAQLLKLRDLILRSIDDAFERGYEFGEKSSVVNALAPQEEK